MLNQSFKKVQVDGAQIAYRRIGNGRPLLVLNGFAATSADWDPSFIHGLAAFNELIQFSGGGHAFMAQYPHRLADLINSFLELA